MTIHDIASAMLRRWYVPLAVLACVALAIVMMARDGGIYTTRTVISFLLPASTSLSPNNGATDQSVITFAEAVVHDTNEGHLSEGYSMADAPYYGAGIREGTLVELSSSGNQWVSAVSKAEIEIDIAGRTLERVESQQAEVVSRVLSVAASLQDVMSVSPQDRISVSVIPLTTRIDLIAPSRGAQLAAGAAMLAVAILTAAWGSVTVDRLLSKRRPDDGRDDSTTPARLPGGTHP
ncbi:MAG: hypothetical protein ABWY23_06735 [Mycetocola sp.]